MKIYKGFITLLLFAVAFSACKKEQIERFDTTFAGIYFEEDSINYSFSVTPLDVHEHLLQIPVQIIGTPASEDRTFQAEIITDKTSAIEGTHYKIDGSMTILKDSIRGYIPLLIERDNLGEDDFQISFRLKEENGFRPVNEPLTKTTVVFNNRVEPPKWVDFLGNPTWPDFNLGPWNPLTYVKFIELFRDLENIVPETYNDMVDQFGQDLENVDSGWPWDYDNTMNKYVLIPLYQYFMEQNPDLGVTIPRPMGY